MNRTDDECYTGTGPAAEVVGSKCKSVKDCCDATQCEIEGKCIRSEKEASAKGPAELWLQLHGDCTPDQADEPVDYTSGNVTWCWHQIHDSDVRYVRADLAEGLPGQPAYAELLAQMDELARLLKGYVERDEMTRCTNSCLYDASSAALSRIKGA